MSPRRARGFSLIEVIAALLLLAITFTALMKVAGGAIGLTQHAAQRSEAAQHALDALGGAAAKLDAGTVTATLRALDADGVVAGATIAMLGALRAREAGDLEALCDNVQSAYDLAGPAAPAELSELVVAAVRMAETLGRPLRGIAPQHVRESLEMHANKGDRDAAYALGRGLCGLANPALGDAVFAGQQNMRKGAAYLLRAADAGCDPAWLHLYRLHSDHRLSVANPQLARYFLEKAAARDQPEAQRMLGALLLREAASLADSEQAIQWLHLAALQGDAHARELLLSLVLPVACEDDETADAAIEQVRADHPWLAARLDVARHFGLTKLEALCFDPVEGLRPWGLVVGKNPFISQIRLSAPRAIPAPSERAQEAARRAAALFEQARGDALSIEGDLRRRSLRQRRVFEKHMLDESTFFADATASELDALRLGPKWAFRARESLSLALGA
jgi:prepilin-type N-terminal cleavage/methylation domain-containing protein